jgi:hypothetical protein
MKTKIIGICICMLLIATAVPAVTSVKNSSINATVPSTPQKSMVGGWIEVQNIHSSDGASGDIFGCAVALSGDTALITAPWNDDNGTDSGSAYVFIRTGTTWTQQAILLTSDGAAGDQFGYFASLDGNTALIGAPADDSSRGSAYVFTRTGTTWTQQQKLLASDGAAGDNFGTFNTLSGDTAFIGAPFDDDNGTNSGSAYVFTRTGTTWTQQQKLLASDGAKGDQFSYYGISLDGDTAIIGANHDDDMGANSGSAYVFTRTGTTWTQQQKLLASDGAAGDDFGFNIALSGNTALIGADGNDNTSGSAYVFTKTAGLTFNIAGGLGVKAVITNNGTSDANDIPWQIHVEGGILGMINKTVNGTIDIPAGGTVTVGTGMLLGFGAISITAKVADEEQTATGTQIIIFSMVKK